MRAPMLWPGGGRCGRAMSMPELAAGLRAIMPAGMALGGTDGVQEPLWPGEAIVAVPHRLAEFAAGRAAARQALAALGLPKVAIPMGADRAPIWPQGAVGSISHCAGACMAVAGQQADFAGIGLDLEPAQPLARDLWPSILRPEEVAADGLDALRIFVAKEAAYKAQYPLSRQVFDFQILRITFQDQYFTAQFVLPVPPFAAGDILQGRVIKAGGFYAALCWIAPETLR
ncbi:MAG: phosphopantetheinyl transferase PptA [Rhodobacteraceae bacterium]|nr:MAG: phosphopantetheinyl transferase PptA [Paracoccaceae bacterium]